jgi:curved DNA-binding protein CbpA
MAWPTSGRVSDVPFSRVFGSLVTGKLTGTLRLVQDGRSYTIEWQDGFIGDADSSMPEDTVGRVALDAGLVEAGVVSDSIRRMAQAHGKSQRAVLVEMGALSDEALDRADRLTLTRRVLRVFALPSASYHVEPGAAKPTGDGGPVEPRWTLYRGLRQHYDERRLERELADLKDRAIKLGPDAAASLELFGFSDEERIVIAYLEKGYWDLGDLVDACLTLVRPIVLASVAALRAVDLLDEQPSASVPRLRKRAREATIKLGKDDVVGAARQAPSITVETPATKGPQPPAPSTRPPSTEPPSTQPPSTQPPATQPPAVSSPQPPVTAKSPPPAPTASSRPPLRTTLTTPPVRPATRPPSSGQVPPAARLSRPNTPVQGTPMTAVGAAGMSQTLREQIAGKLAQIDAHADHFKVLEVPRDASSAQVKAAYFALAKTYHPDRLALVQLESMRPLVEKIFARLSDAYAALADEARRKEYLGILAQGGEQAVKRRSDDEAAAATKLLTAEEHFRKGEMALRRQLWQTAIEEFQAALALNEEEAEHHAYLAWARWCAAPQKDAVFVEVKRGLSRAVELSSRCLPAFLYMGQIYSARGELDRAYGAFQRVLDINPNHVDALREVRLIDMRRAKGERKGLLDRFKKK